MSQKLIQKHLLHGRQEFELQDDLIKVKVNSLIAGRKEFDVVLAMINPEPIINKPWLDFHSRVKCRPLLSLYLNKPTPEEFNNFVNTLKQRAQEEYNVVSGLNVGTKTTVTDDFGQKKLKSSSVSPSTDSIKDKRINVEEVKNAISLLETYVNNDDTHALIAALKSLNHAPEDHSKLIEVGTAFNKLGSSQGAVLTYAPYISILLSEHPME